MLRASHQDVRLDNAAQGGEGEERPKDSSKPHKGDSLRSGDEVADSEEQRKEVRPLKPSGARGRQCGRPGAPHERRQSGRTDAADIEAEVRPGESEAMGACSGEPRATTRWPLPTLRMPAMT